MDETSEFYGFGHSPSTILVMPPSTVSPVENLTLNESVFDVNEHIRMYLGNKSLQYETLIPITCIYFIIFFTGIFGNVMTMSIITTNSFMHTATNYYLFNLGNKINSISPFNLVPFCDFPESFLSLAMQFFCFSCRRHDNSHCRYVSYIIHYFQERLPNWAFITRSNPYICGKDEDSWLIIRLI